MIKKAFGLRLLAGCLCLVFVACASPEEKKARYLAAADGHMAAKRYREAILEYRNAIKVDARFGEARFKLAQAYEQTQNEQAIREYLRAADLLPDRADVQVKAAAILLAGQQHERARTHADLAIKADPGHVEAQIIRAYALAGLKDLEGAVEELEKATASAPGDYRPYTSLGAMAATRGDMDEAEAAFKKAVDTDPSSAPAKLALAYFYWSASKGEETERILLDVIKADQTHERANRLLAMFYIANRRWNEAEVPLNRLVAAKDTRATLLLGDLYLSTDREEQARPLYESLKADKNATALAVSRLATLDYRAGKRDQALAVLDAQLKETPKSVPLLALKARWLIAAKRSEEALKTAQDAVAAEAESPEAQFMLGMSHAANGDPQAAITAYNEVLRLSPAMAAAQIELSKMLLATGQKDQALQQAEAARKTAPANPAARYTVARALLTKGDIRAAETETLALAKQFPNSAPVRALHGQVLMARSNTAGAVKEFDQALAIDPADPTARGLNARWRPPRRARRCR
jgi:tetratricopeptide (TPR) repeat protein